MKAARGRVGLALGVAAVCLLGHAREGRAQCASVDVFTLELVSVTVDGQAVTELSPWRPFTLHILGWSPGSATLSIAPTGGEGRSIGLQPSTGAP